MSEEQQETGVESIAGEGTGVGVCDESKCVSGGIGGILNVDGVRFDCYFFPREHGEDELLCANGYEGRPIENDDRRCQQRRRRTLTENDTEEDSCEIKERHKDEEYYTCCPVGFTGKVGGRHCNDPMPVKSGNDNDDSSTFDHMPCNDDIDRKYPRPMTRSLFYPDTYVCCDSLLIIANDTITIDDDDTWDNDTSIATGNPSSSSSGDGCCDESKCISQLKIFLQTEYSKSVFSPDFSCWAEGPAGIFGFDCESGYKGVAVTTEYSIFTKLPSHEGKLFSYYTCCPPGYLNNTKNCGITATTNTSSITPSPPETIQRRCSDPIQLYEENDTMTCDIDGLNDIVRYPVARDDVQVSTAVFESYICCDTRPLDLLQSNDRRFFSENECLPCNAFDDQLNACFIDNVYGQLWAMVCNDPGKTWIHIHQVTSNTPSAELVVFECCKTAANSTNSIGDGPLVQDLPFRQTVYTQICFSSVALAFSLSLFLGLSHSMVSKSRQTTDGNQRRRRRQATVSQQDYTCYNLYLVYLAVPDIFLNIFILALYGRYVDQKWNPSFGGYIVDSVLWEQRKPLDNSFILACSAANTYLNAIIAFEVYTLLDSSHNAIRHAPPGILNVSMKAVAVYAIACIVFLLRWFLDDTKCSPKLQAIIYFMASTGIPMVYLLYVSAVIYRRGLIPSTTGKLKVISLYFLRIILVFIFLWLPGMILLALSRKPYDQIHISDYNPKYFSVALIFCSLQPILSTCMAMTKPDVRKSVFNLLSLPISWCFRLKEDNDNTVDEQ
jgi:hypothetical protein